MRPDPAAPAVPATPELLAALEREAYPDLAELRAERDPRPRTQAGSATPTPSRPMSR